MNLNHVSEKYRKHTWRDQLNSDFHLAGSLRRSRSASWRKKESRNFHLGLIFSLLFLSILFYTVPRLYTSELVTIKVEEPIIITPPATEPLKRMPRPEPVKIPIASEEDDVPEDLEIDYAIFEPQDLEDIVPPEPEDEVEEVAYIPIWKLGRKPEIIKRIVPQYPKLARIAGVTGTVVCEICISKTGRVEDAKIVKSIPILDDAALAAVKQWVFSPGLQRDIPVRVKMNIPVIFTLN